MSPDARLGSGVNGASDIKMHAWFAEMNWRALEEQQLEAPIQPQVFSQLDTSNFDDFEESEHQVESKCPDSRVWGNSLWSPIDDF